jgi:hypothetical protein
MHVKLAKTDSAKMYEFQRAISINKTKKQDVIKALSSFFQILNEE